MSSKGKAIVEQLEREFPLFVFNTHTYSGTLYISIVKASYNFSFSMKGKRRVNNTLELRRDISRYYYKDLYTKDEVEFLDIVFGIITTELGVPLYSSNMTTTRFELVLGKWDKPYKLIK